MQGNRHHFWGTKNPTHVIHMYISCSRTNEGKVNEMEKTVYIFLLLFLLSPILYLIFRLISIRNRVPFFCSFHFYWIRHSFSIFVRLLVVFRLHLTHIQFVSLNDNIGRNSSVPPGSASTRLVFRHFYSVIYCY